MDYTYLIETKNEFLNTVINILTPQIYNGLITMYEHSMRVFNHLKQKIENNPKNISSQIVNYFKLNKNDFSKMTVEEVENEYQKIKIEIFKKYVNDIASKNNMEIEEEYLRIKNESRFADIFDNLMKACFKSYLLFFTFDPKTKNSKFNSEKYYDNINIRDFIHKCYVETCTFFQNNPELFIKRNRKSEINEHIKTCIIMSIRKSLPYNDMINEYLRIDFEMKENKKEDLHKMEEMVNNIMEKNKTKYVFKEIVENEEKHSKIDKIIEDNKNKKIIISEEIVGDLYEDIERENMNKKFKKNKVAIDNYLSNNSEKDHKNNENKEDSESNKEIIENDTSSNESDNESNNENDKVSQDNNESDNESDKVSQYNDTSDDESNNENDKTSVMGNEKEIDKSSNVINSLMSLPKRNRRISKFKNNIDENKENYFNELIK